MAIEKHICSNQKEFTVENHGDGWYLYFGEVKGERSLNFCPYCGIKLEV